MKNYHSPVYSLLDIVLKTFAFQGNNLNFENLQSIHDHNHWILLDTPYIIPNLYLKLHSLLAEKKVLWITHQLHLLRLLFAKEISTHSVTIVNDISQHYQINNPANMENQEPGLYFADYSLPCLNKLLKNDHWDHFLIEAPLFPYPIKETQMYQLLKSIKTSKLSAMLLYPNKYALAIKKICPKLSSFCSYHHFPYEILVKVIVTNNQNEKLLQLINIIKKEKGKGIIFVSHRDYGELLQSFLSSKGYASAYITDKLTNHHKRYLKERFILTNHINPLNIIIIHGLGSLNFIQADVNWIIHFNFAGGWTSYLQDILWTGKENTTISSYIFYSYHDKTIREALIRDYYPDAKSLRNVYSYLLHNKKWGNYRFMNLKKASDDLRLPYQKLQMSLDVLTKLNIIEKEISVITVAKILIEKKSIPQNTPAKWISHVCPNQPHNNTIDLILYCNQENLSPFSLSKNLIDLESQHKLLFLDKEIANSYIVKQEQYCKLKPGFEEISKIIPIDLFYKELITLEKTIHQFFLSDFTCNPIQDDANNGLTLKTDQPISMSQLIRTAILLVVSESSFPIGKNLIALILTGSNARKIKSLQLDQLSMYSSLSFIKHEWIKKLIINLILENCLQESTLNHFYLKGLKLTAKGKSKIAQEAKLKKILWKRHQLQFANHHNSIYPLLKRMMASQYPFNGKLNQNILKAIAFLKPQTIEELSMIKGIKEKDLLELGSYILPITQDNQFNSNINIYNTGEESILTDIDYFVNEEYFPVLNGDFTKGFSLSSYTVPSEGRRAYTPIGKAIHNFKYKDKKILSDQLTNKLLAFLKKHHNFTEVDFICSVPSHSNYPSINNLLGEWLMKVLKLPYYHDLLIRTKSAKPQKSLTTLNEKAKNSRNLFNISENHSIINSSILLLDDIYDSGITVNACSRLLKNHLAKKVFVLTCTRTSYREIGNIF